MIHPNMATMLAFVLTDAKLEQDFLRTAFVGIVNRTFNAVTVDGDTSTNDMAVILANGAAGETDSGEALNAIEGVMRDLARAIARDGEGATKFMSIQIAGGQSEAECRTIAYAIAHSPLVKTAFFASDPNLGRILAAIGYAGIHDLDVSKLQLFLGDVLVAEQGGRAASYREEDGQRIMQQAEILVRVELHRGEASATVWTCDFSYDYVKINAEYRS